MTARALRIGMIIDSFDGDNNGVVVATRRLVAGLRRRHQVVIIGGGGEGEPDRVSLPVLRIPGLHRKIARNGMQLARPVSSILVEAIRNVDILQIQMPYLLAMRAMAIANRLGVPVVLVYHVQTENWLYQAGVRSERINDLVSSLYVKALYNRAQLVVCLNRFGEEALRRFGLRVPTEIVSNGLPDEFCPGPRPPERDDLFTVLTVGRLAIEKQHALLIDAIGRSRHAARIRLVIAGDGALRAQLEAQAARLANRPIIRSFPNRELVDVYRGADLYVHASLVELESVSTLEAIGCGLPVLLANSPLSAATQFALDERSLFAPSSAEDLAAKLDYWIEHPEELARARLAYAELAGRYRLGASVEKMERIYGSLLGGRG